MTTNTNNEISICIQQLMAKHSITQKELAERSGVSPGQVSRILAGSHLPRRKTLSDLAKGLGYNVDHLLRICGQNAESAVDALDLPKEVWFKGKEEDESIAALNRFSQAIDELLRNGLRVQPQSKLSVEPQSKLSALATSMRKLLNAEAIGLFLVQPGLHQSLMLMASDCDRLPPDLNRGRLVEIRSEPRGGLTGHVFNKWRTEGPKVTNFNFEALDRNPYIAEKYQEHLTSGQGYSTLILPLMDRKAQLIGLVSLANKKGSSGEATSTDEFSARDELVATLFASKLVIVLEMLKRAEAFEGIISDLQEDVDLEALSGKILRRAMKLVGGDRGDFAVWEKHQVCHKLVLRAVSVASAFGGVTGRTLPVNSPVPDASFMGALWRDDKSIIRISNNVARETSYYESHPDVKSEVAVKFEWGGRPLGILNIESFRESAFDEQDRDALETIAKFAVLAVQIGEEEVQLGRAIRQTLEYSDKLSTALTGILEAINAVHGLDGGLIYLPNVQDHKLECKACMGCPHLGDQGTSFSFKFEERNSAALRVWHSRAPFYSQTPEHDADVSQEGLSRFQIRGPLLGLPLLFSDELVGVLIVWSKNGPRVTKGHITRLGSLATLAAWKIAVWKSNQELKEWKDAMAAQELLEALPQCVFRKDRQGKFTFANKAFCKFVSKPREEIIGAVDNDLFTSRDVANYRRDDLKVMENGDPILNYRETNTLIGSKRSVEVIVSKFPLRDAHGKIVGIHCMFTPAPDQPKQLK